MTRSIFLASLPRAGSTWVQSLIAASPEVASAPERWVMLPLVEGILHGRGYATYGQGTYRLAMEEGDPAALQAGARAFAQAYYDSQGGGAAWFLDKTPRYSLICEQLADLMPEAKVILLFRDPVDVARSLAVTFGGRWNTLFRYEVDFVQGIAKMCALSRQERNNVLAIRYEDARADPEATTRSIGQFLGLDLPPPGEAGRVKIAGALGDPRKGAASPARPLTWGERREIGRFLDRITDGDLATMGYERAALEAKLNALPGRFSWRDLPTVIVRGMYKAGMAHAIERLFRRMGNAARQPASANPQRFGIE